MWRHVMIDRRLAVLPWTLRRPSAAPRDDFAFLLAGRTGHQGRRHSIIGLTGAHHVAGQPAAGCHLGAAGGGLEAAGADRTYAAEPHLSGDCQIDCYGPRAASGLRAIGTLDEVRTGYALMSGKACPNRHLGVADCPRQHRPRPFLKGDPDKDPTGIPSPVNSTVR